MNTLSPSSPTPNMDATFWTDYGALKADVGHLKDSQGEVKADVTWIKAQLMTLSADIKVIVDDHKNTSAREDSLLNWVEDRKDRESRRDSVMLQVRNLCLIVLGAFISTAVAFGVTQAQKLPHIPPLALWGIAGLFVVLVVVVLTWRPKT